VTGEAAPEAGDHDAPVAVEEPDDEHDEPQAGPVIHVPGRELGSENGDAPAPVKKKTRRGSRGGKNRRKTPAAAAAAGTSVAATAEAEPQAAEPGTNEPAANEPAEEQAALNGDERVDENDDENWGYTPMSEWGLDGNSE
jgi:hypothetical protein